MLKYRFFLLQLLSYVKPILSQKIEAEMNDGDSDNAADLRFLLAVIVLAEDLLGAGK